MNLCINGSFDIWTARSGQASSSATWVASRWLFGPGYGGAADWSIEDFAGEDIPGRPRHYLRLRWTTAPTQGEQPPSNRFTFLENHGLRDARQLSGCWVDVTWWLRLASGTIAVIPIIWHNFVNGNYAIYSGEAFPVRAEKGWHPLTQSIYVPAVTTQQIDATSYTGFGLDFLSLYGPTLDVACVSVERKTIERIDPQLERVRANGQFWN